MKRTKKIPDFKNEDEEREFWSTKSPLDYLKKPRKVFLDDLVDLKPKYISIRLPAKMVSELKTYAGGIDVAYQALIKMWLGERLKQEKQAL